MILFTLVRLNVCMCFRSPCPSGTPIVYVCVSVCVLLHCCCYCCCCYCYYCCYCCFSCPPPLSVPLSMLSPQLKLGEKSDRLQSKTRVLRPPYESIFILFRRMGECVVIVLTLQPLTVWTCFRNGFYSLFFFPSFFVFPLALFCLRSHSLYIEDIKMNFMFSKRRFACYYYVSK